MNDELLALKEKANLKCYEIDEQKTNAEKRHSASISLMDTINRFEEAIATLPIVTQLAFWDETLRAPAARYFTTTGLLSDEEQGWLCTILERRLLATYKELAEV